MAGSEVYMAFPSTVGATVTVAPAAARDDEGLDLEPDPDGSEIESRTGAIHPDPSLEDEFGPEFEDQVRKSLGAPEPFADKARLVDARPGRDADDIQSKPKSRARKSLSVN